MKFTKVFLAALLAVVVGSILSGLLWLFVILGIAGSMEEPTVVAPESILKIDMADNITDSPSTNPFAGIDFMSLQSTKSYTLLNVLRAIEAAKEDPKIKGIYMNFTGAGGASTAIVEELRAAIVDFKESGKFVVAYNDTYSQVGYYLASAADKIYMQPEGGMSWVGLSATLMFYKGTMDKLGLSAEVFRPTVCKYKSAVEPYILNKMSDANRAQMQAMCDDMWGVMTQTIAESRGVDVKELNRLADDLELMFPEDALKHKLVDGLLYADQMDEVFENYGVQRNSEGEFDMVTLGEYCSLAKADLKNLTAPKIGIVYADGEIVDGEGSDDKIYGTTLAQTIAKARKDDKIKAVVLRVNSPGGSALASDIIWREVELLKKEKPVIVSMGSYAASGGYYISCPADAIVADKLTLTGSIGVFGMMIEGGDMLKNKLGITFDTVKTNPSADMGQAVFGMLQIRKCTPVERNTIIRSVDKVYETFTSKVAAGRNLPIEKVLDIAQGRVWSGTRAIDIGLVDANGGLKQAISVAADKAGIADNFRVTEVLEELTPFAAFMQSLNSQVRTAISSDEMNYIRSTYSTLEEILARQGVQAYCPYVVMVE